MKRFSLVLFSLIAGIVFLGCEPMLLYEETFPEFKAPADKALLVIIRPSGMIGNPAKIYLDRKYMTGTTGNTVTSFPVDPGEHLVVSEINIKGKIKFNYQAGKIYYILQVAFPIPIGITTLISNTLSPMSGEDAVAKLEEEKGKCRYTRPNPNNIQEDMDEDDWKDELEDWDEWAKDKPEDAKKEIEYPGY